MMDDRVSPKPASILLWTLFLGLAAGTLELAVFLAKCHWLDPRNYNLGRHFPWMFPIGGALILLGPGLLMAVAAWFRPLPGRLVLGVLLFPACLGLLFRGPILTAFCLVLATGLSYRGSAWLARRSEAFDRVARVGLVALTAALGLTVAACFGLAAWVGDEVKPPPGEPRNVLLLVLDTVRAANLSLYGYRRETTPTLARLAGRGVRFDRAFSTAPWTAPSHAGMFTGRAAHEVSIDWVRPLDRRTPTIAETLAAAGYDTAGFVANTTYCSYETGLDRGFGHYEDYDVTWRGVLLCSSLVQRVAAFIHKYPRVEQRLGLAEHSSGDRKSAARINGDFLEWLDAREGQAPFFAFLNYFDAHHPYLPPDDAADPGFGREPSSLAEFRLIQTWWEGDKVHLKPADVDLAIDSYDRCIRYIDDQIGRLFDDLGRRGVLKDTLVIVTADHGEDLGEHQLYGHGVSVYRPELHVPLLVIDPTSTVPRVVADPVSLRDLPATVLDWVGQGDPAADRPTFPGRSLRRRWAGATLSDDEPVLSEIATPPDGDPNGGRSPAKAGPLVSLVDRRYHYIRGSRGDEQLFDLGDDPAELGDLARRPEFAEALEKFRSRVPRFSRGK